MPRIKKTTREETSDIKVDLIDTKGKSTGSLDIPRELFGAKIIPNLLAQAVYIYRTNQRQGTVAVKTRSEVVGSTRKIYRQKGTGKARHGANKAPIFVGGGIAHGPKTRNFALDLSKNERKKALYGALTSKLADGKVTVVANFLKLQPKTKVLVESLKQIGIKTDKNAESTLLITGSEAKNLLQAGNNIPFLTIHPLGMLNAYEVLRHNRLVVLEEAIEGARALQDAKKKTEELGTKVESKVSVDTKVKPVKTVKSPIKKTTRKEKSKE